MVSEFVNTSFAQVDSFPLVCRFLNTAIQININGLRFTKHTYSVRDILKYKLQMDYRSPIVGTHTVTNILAHICFKVINTKRITTAHRVPARGRCIGGSHHRQRSNGEVRRLPTRGLVVSS